MMMDTNQLSRAQVLIEQQRYKEAEAILNDLLIQNPTSSYILAITAEVSLQLDKKEKALELINNAIAIEPDEAYCYYIKAKILLDSENYDGAEENLTVATTFNPEDNDAFALWAFIKQRRKQYEKALRLANQALSLAPENILALNTRSSALLKLDKKEEAFNTIEGALKEDPNNAFTHANYGWSLLEKGDHKKALTHFQEALVNDPNNEYAQAGMAEAIKARYSFYRLFMKYSFWISSLQGKSQWAIMIGYYFGVKALRAIANTNETLSLYLTPLIVGLSLIAFSTWVITPISNLFLRLNKYGVHLLEKYEKWNSNIVGACFILFAVGLLGSIAIGTDPWFALTVFGFSMMVPASQTFTPAKYKHAFLIATAAMFLLGVASISEAFVTGEIYNSYTMPYVIGFIAYQWGANALMIKSNNV